MFTTASVRETPNDTDSVYAFHIMGEVSAEDMSAMADYMNRAFDTHDKVSMLLIFDRYGGAERGASADWSVIKSRLRSLTNVDKYAVVNAPDSAESMIRTMGALIPVDVRTFDDEDAAWAFVGARALDRDIHR